MAKIGKAKKITAAPVHVPPVPSEHLRIKYDQGPQQIVSAAMRANLDRWGAGVCRMMQAADPAFADCWTWFAYKCDDLDPEFTYGGERDDVLTAGYCEPVEACKVKEAPNE
jgi:hypothetical protein